MIYQQFNLVRRLYVLDNVLIGRLPHLTGWRRGRHSCVGSIATSARRRADAWTMWMSMLGLTSAGDPSWPKELTFALLSTESAPEVGQRWTPIIEQLRFNKAQIGQC